MWLLRLGRGWNKNCIKSKSRVSPAYVPGKSRMSLGGVRGESDEMMSDERREGRLGHE